MIGGIESAPDMVITVTDRVTELVEQGQSYDEVAAAGPPTEFNATWGDPERFLTAVYAELGGEGYRGSASDRSDPVGSASRTDKST